MKITFSDLKDNIFDLEIQEGSTLKDIKQIILEQKKLDLTFYKIFFSQKIISDDFIFKASEMGPNPIIVLLDIKKKESSFNKRFYFNTTDLIKFRNFRLPLPFPLLPICEDDVTRDISSFDRYQPIDRDRIDSEMNQFSFIPDTHYSDEMDAIIGQNIDFPMMDDEFPILTSSSSSHDFHEPEDDLQQINPDIQLSEADHQALRRLASTGQDRLTTMHIYLICERNEEHARELLLSLH